MGQIKVKLSRLTNNNNSNKGGGQRWVNMLANDD